MESLLNSLSSLNFNENNKKERFMNIIEKCDRDLLENERICSMTTIDWGKSMAVSNQYIQRNILRSLLNNDYNIYSVDDSDFPKDISIANNSPGFDLVVITPEKKTIRIQSKLRQVKGVFDYSMQTHFETTRRNSEKNKNKNHTGHICYSLDEFDYVMVSLVNVREKNLSIRSNCDLWSYSLIPIWELEDKSHNCCVSHIKPELLKKYLVKDHIEFFEKPEPVEKPEPIKEKEPTEPIKEKEIIEKQEN